MNEGHNTGIMEACETLAGYSHLIELTRSFAQVMSPADAIEAAIEQCIEEGVLRDYLVERRSEVISTFLTEWDEEEYRAFLRRESREDGFAEGRAEGHAEGHAKGRAEGHAEGREEGLAEGLAEGLETGRSEATAHLLYRAIRMIEEGSLDLSTASQLFGIPEEEIRVTLEKLFNKSPSSDEG